MDGLLAAPPLPLVRTLKLVMSWKISSKAHQEYYWPVLQELYIGGLKTISTNESWHLATTCWNSIILLKSKNRLETYQNLSSQTANKNIPKDPLVFEHQGSLLFFVGHFLSNAKKQTTPFCRVPVLLPAPMGRSSPVVALRQISCSFSLQPPLFVPHYRQSEYICTCCPGKGRSGHVGHVNNSKKCRFSSSLKGTSSSSAGARIARTSWINDFVTKQNTKRLKITWLEIPFQALKLLRNEGITFKQQVINLLSQLSPPPVWASAQRLVSLPTKRLGEGPQVPNTRNPEHIKIPKFRAKIKNQTSTTSKHASYLRAS